jgi:hypothetical protein
MTSTLRKLRFRTQRINSIRVPLIWLRHRGLDPRDVFLASYPRSGQYWLRFLLIEFLTSQSVEFDSVDKMIPKIGVHGGAPALLPGGRRLIQTHELYRKEYKKAIYLVRDVRDVVLSEFLQAKASQLPLYINDFDDYLLATLQGKVQGFGAWHHHVHSWLDSPLEKRGDLLVLRFEEMRGNPEEALTRVLQFLGAHIDPQAVLSAVANNSLQRMRAKEDRRTLYRSNTEEDRHVHGGTVSGWREKLSLSQVQLIQRYAKSALTRLGYPLAGEPAAKATGGRP